MERNQRLRNFLDRMKGMTPGNIGESLKEFGSGVKRGFSETPENTRKELFDHRTNIGLDEPPQLTETFNQSGVGEAIREGLTIYDLPGGMSDRRLYDRSRQGIGLKADPGFWNGISESKLNSDDPVERYLEEEKLRRRAQTFKELARTDARVANHIGTAIGQLGADVTLDKTRAIYWLANAVQASGRLINEAVLLGANPNINTRRTITDRDLVTATDAGLLVKERSFGNPKDEPEPTGVDGVGWRNPSNFRIADPSVKEVYEGGKKVFKQRRLNNNMLSLAGMGLASYAINQGVGLVGEGGNLLSPREGYAAASPSEDDPRETQNVIEEVGLKYLMGRTGNMLPYAEFSKLRPDVTKAEYNNYKNFLRDKDLDFNPFDGDFNIGAGFLKYTNDPNSVHGAELNFLGKSVPVDEAVAPTAGAILGAGLGGILPNIRQIRLKGQRPGRRFRTVEEIKSNPVKEVPRLVYNMVPEVGAKKYDKQQDLLNTAIKPGSILDKVTGNIEDYFMETNKVTGMRDLQVPRQVQSIAAGSLGGLLIAGEIGRRNEQDRREEKFDKLNPGVDYQDYKAKTTKLLDDEYKRRAGLSQDQKDKGKAYSSRVSQQDNLYENATRQLALVGTMLDGQEKQIATAKINEALLDLEKAKAIEEERQKPSDNGSLYPLTSLGSNPMVIDPTTY